MATLPVGICGKYTCLAAVYYMSRKSGPILYGKLLVDPFGPIRDTIETIVANTGIEKKTLFSKLL